MASGSPDTLLCLIYALLFNACSDRSMSRTNGPHRITNPTIFCITLRFWVLGPINTCFRFNVVCEFYQ
jgi:hypothetical protein